MAPAASRSASNARVGTAKTTRIASTCDSRVAVSLLPFLLVTGAGAIASLLLRSRPTMSWIIGVAALGLAVLAALLIRSSESIVIGTGGLATTGYLRLFLVLASTVALLLALVGEATLGRREAPAAALGILATSALALSVPDARTAVLAATAGGAFGALVALAPVGGRAGATVGARVLRATAVAGTMAISATAWIGRDLSQLAAQPIVFGLAYLAFALAVAIRFGAIPAHTWAARLTEAVPETAFPLVTAIGPAALAIVALAWADASIAPLLVDLGSVRAVVLSVAIASIVLASFAALIQDDIEHIVGYAIVGDAGVVMLAIAALDPGAWAPARMWILAFVVVRSAFAAWAAATRATFGTGRVDDLRGWLVRSPILAVVLGLVVLGSIGWPGLAAASARGTLVDRVFDGPLQVLVLIGTLSPLLYYARLVAVGIERPGLHPRADGWRPVFTKVDLTDLRAWVIRTWSENRIASATGGAALLALLALVVSAGAFGAAEAAAGLPPTLGVSGESFAPGEPPPIESEAPIGTEAPIGSDAPIGSGAPIGSEGPGPSDEPIASLTAQTLPPSTGPSFEPVPTP
jgi:formate hydrogenlyase subunit 3/multisubunit Na+/H+ antiporter MnhD subunit